MNKTNNPTLQNVAREANVSTATVSRSINEPHKVAKTTLNRIQKVIQRLGYTPNFGGKVLASNRSNTVGAIIPTMANAMFASGLQAFQEVLSQSGIRLLVASSGYDSADELNQIRSLITHGADGLLLIGSSRPPETTKFLEVRNIPHVISWCYEQDKNRVYSGFDNENAARKMAFEVLKFGHRRIAMIGGLARGNDRARNRIAGVKSAIAEYGKGSILSQVVETHYSLQDGGNAFSQMMSDSPPPTAIICGNDVLAAGAVIRARELSIKVPEEVSITGFDDIILASAVSPSLTTIRIPQIEMGKTAATLLLKLLRHDSDIRSVEFDTEVIIRESLGWYQEGRVLSS